MAEIGIDISGHRSKAVDESAGQDFDTVITVCDNAKESCPAFPGTTKRLHWSLEDPAGVEGPVDVRIAAAILGVKSQVVDCTRPSDEIPPFGR
jgi:arsenate reductase